MADTAVLRINAERSQLSRVRAWVREQALIGHANRAAVDDLVLAADEAVTNIIVHGYLDQPGPIELEMIIQPGVLKLILRDQAPLFDPTCVPAPDLSLPLEQRPVGGMGIHLVRHSVDEFVYETPAAGGNQITLVKILS